MSAREKEAEGPSAAPTAAAEKGGASPGRATLGVDGADGLSGDGLPYKQKSLFQSSLGADLSNVRVHTGPEAAKQADAVGARAFARGSDIMFAEGQYNPGTREGDQLLAHEVAHTVQQRDASAAAGPLKTTSPGDSAEKGADHAAAAMVDGAPASVQAEPMAIAKKGTNEDVAPDAAPANDAPAGEAPIGAEAKEEGEGSEKEGEEEIGELSVERVGAEQDEGEDQPVGEPQNLEAGRQFLASKGAGAEEGAESEGAEAGGSEAPAPQQAPSGGDEGGELPPEMAAHLADVQAEVQASTEAAQAEADAFKAESRARQDRFDNEQNAVALERLQSMSAAEKRSTLIEMGADEKTVKKMKDAELDGVITGKLETEQRRTKILGMDEKELAALSPAAKSQFLVDLGVEKKDLDKIGPQKAAKAFDDVMRVAHVPGKHKVKVKIKGGLLAKSWEISVNVDADGNPEFDAKKKGGFLSKLWGWVKLALPVIAIVLAPVTGGISLLLLSVYQTVTAIAQGDWLGAIIGAAGAIAGLGAIKAAGAIAQGAAQGAVQGAAGAAQGAAMGAAKFAASGLGKISSVALKVQKAAQAAKATMAAAKAKSPGSLLSALADGASTFAGFSADKAGAFAKKMTDWSKRLEKWSNVVSGGEKVIAGVKNKDPGAALSGAFDAASAYVSKPNEGGEETSAKAKDFQRYSRMAGYVSAGQSAAKGKPPNYGGVVDAAMGLATELKTKGGKTPKALEDANRIVSSASRLTSAIQSNNPEAMAEAALGLAQTIQTAKYDDPDPNPNAKDTDGDGISDDREKVLKRYSTASSIITFASSAIDAANAKPRPNYMAALSAGTQLIADLTENKRVDQAAVITKRLDNWTSAIQSKNQAAIFEAGKAFGEAIDGMRSLIEQEREDAKKAAQAKLAPGESLEEAAAASIPKLDVEVTPGVDGLLPSTPIVGLVELPGAVEPNRPNLGDDVDGTAPSTEAKDPMAGRKNTSGANYTVQSGDSLSAIAAANDITVEALRSANPQLVADSIYAGQRIKVPTTAGATPRMPIPGVETYETNARVVLPGEVPPVMPPIPEHVTWVINAVDSFAMIHEWEEPLPQFLATIKDAAGKINGLHAAWSKDPKTAKQAYDRYYRILDLAASSAVWADGWVKTVAKYEGEFKNLIDDDGEAQAVRVLTQYARIGRATARIAKIPLSTLDGMEKFVTAAGYKPDGSRASLQERAQAAYDLANGANSLRGELSWMVTEAAAAAPRLAEKLAKLGGRIATVGTNVGTRVGQAGTAVGERVAGLADDALNAVRATSSRVFTQIGGPRAVDIVVKTVTPYLEAVAKSRGAQVATQLGQQIASKVGILGAKLGTSVASNVALRTAIIELGAHIGGVAASGPAMLAVEYLKWEVQFVAELYATASASFSQWLSMKAFGKMHRILVEEVRAYSIATPAQCDAFFGFAENLVRNGYYTDVKQNWNQTWREQLPNRVSDIKYLSGRTLTQNLQNYGNGTKTQAATALKTIAVEFLNSEFRRIFRHDP